MTEHIDDAPTYGQLLNENAELRDALEGMCEQFAYYKRGGFLTDGGLSALETAFYALGWEHPHPAPHRKCDEPGCEDEGECGTPDTDGRYRRVCLAHFVAINRRIEKGGA